MGATDERTGGRALVTGASSGIGEVYARRLARERIDLLLVARRADRLDALAGALRAAHGVGVETIAVDLAADEGVAAVEQAVADGPPVEWLVSSAGFGTRGRYETVAPEKIARMARLHVEANARLTRAVVPGMVARGRGTIVLVSSLSAFATGNDYVAYSASKAYINMLATGIAEENRGAGLRVQALCPGLTRTEFTETEEYRDFKYDSVPAWAWMTAEEVVEQSMRALAAGRRDPIFVPGRGNRAFVGALRAPLLGTALRSALGVLGRGRNLY